MQYMGTKSRVSRPGIPRPQVTRLGVVPRLEVHRLEVPKPGIPRPGVPRPGVPRPSIPRPGVPRLVPYHEVPSLRYPDHEMITQVVCVFKTVLSLYVTTLCIAII